MARAVKFDGYGEVDVLHVVDVPRPAPAPGQLLVRVKAAGINPGEASVRKGLLAKQWPAKFPSGEGSDFAGVVEEVGKGVSSFRVGDEVIGFTNDRASHAELVVAPADQVVARPPNVPWEQAGALPVAGTTAFAAVRAVGVKAGDTVVVSGAAGGVGSIAVQLARNANARVVGIASEAHHAWLLTHGVIPVAYGPGLAERVRQMSNGRIDAFIDTYGHGYVDLAMKLGVAPSRIDTIIDFEAAAKHHVKTDGMLAAAGADVLAELARMMAEGQLEIPIAKSYPLVDVREAYRELERRHTQGKIVLMP